MVEQIEKLQNIAKKIRRGIIEQVYKAGSGHPGGSLSIADILTGTTKQQHQQMLMNKYQLR